MYISCSYFGFLSQNLSHCFLTLTFIMHLTYGCVFSCVVFGMSLFLRCTPNGWGRSIYTHVPTMGRVLPATNDPRNPSIIFYPLWRVIFTLRLDSIDWTKINVWRNVEMCQFFLSVLGSAWYLNNNNCNVIERRLIDTKMSPYLLSCRRGDISTLATYLATTKKGKNSLPHPVWMA